MLLGVALAGCQAGPTPVIAPGNTEAGSNPDIDQGTRRVIVTYLIAHGMAESYVMSGRATRAGLLDLFRSDHAALAAVSGQAKAPSWTMLSQADGAVQALIATTTALDGAKRITGRRAAAR